MTREANLNLSLMFVPIVKEKNKSFRSLVFAQIAIRIWKISSKFDKITKLFKEHVKIVMIRRKSIKITTFVNNAFNIKKRFLIKKNRKNKYKNQIKSRSTLLRKREKSFKAQ